MSRKMMLVTFMVLPFLAARPVLAQDTLKLDLGKALEIALSENPTVKVADKEIQKKKYARKGSYASLFPQISFAGDYNRTLKKQVMYMDFDMGDMGGGSLPEGTDMSSMDEGFEVGRSNNWSLGFNASMPLVNASLWKSLSISALDVELAVEQARSSKIAMVNQVKKSFYAVLLASDSYRVFKQSYDNAMENYLDIKRKYEQGTVAEYDLIRADVTVKNTEPNLLQAENSLTLAKWQLKALLGMDLDLNIDCDGQLTDFKSSLFADYLSTDTTLSENTDLKQLDLQAEQLKKTPSNLEFGNSSGTSLMFMDGDEEGTVFYVDSTGLYRYAFGGNVIEQVIDGSLNTISSANKAFEDMVLGPDGKIYIAEIDYNSSTMSGKLYSYTYSADTPTVPDTELTIYSLEDNSSIRQAVAMFQKKYPDIYLTLETGMSGDDGVTRTDALKTLNTEIMAGKGPDILILDGISSETYVEQGMLEDLSGILKAAGLLSNIEEAYKSEDGSIYYPCRCAGTSSKNVPREKKRRSPLFSIPMPTGIVKVMVQPSVAAITSPA